MQTRYKGFIQRSEQRQQKAGKVLEIDGEMKRDNTKGGEGTTNYGCESPFISLVSSEHQ